MAKRSAVEMLPEEVKSWLDKTLAVGNFSGYELLEELLKERGYSIGKSSIHRYGQKLERRLAAIKASTQAAQLIVEAAPDEGDARSEAILGLVQTELFDSIVAMQDIETETDPERRVKILSSVAKSISTMARASVNQKKWSQEVRAKAQAVADSVSKIAKKGGLTAEAAETIRRQILGIAS